MKRTLALICAFIALPSCFVNAQTFEWAGRYGGNGEDVVVSMFTDANGNVYSTGYYTFNCDFDISESDYIIGHDADYEIFVTKTNSDGQFQWAKSFGGVSGENGTAITADADGNVYVTGVYQENADFDPGQGEFILTSTGSLDIFVIKLDPAGNLIWAKSIGGTDYESTTGIGVDASGNVYLSGYFYFTMDFDPSSAEYTMDPTGSGDGFAVKLDPSGNLIWAKKFGGPEFELATGMTVLANGDSYITGNFTGTADFDPAPDAAFTLSTPNNYDGLYLLRLDADGGFVSAVKAGQTDNHLYGMSVDVDASGAAYLTGYFGGNIDFTVVDFSSLEFYNGYLVKVNPDGSNAWAKYLNADLGSQSYDVEVNSLGEVLAFGFYSGTIAMDNLSLGPVASANAQENFLVKYSASGNVVSAFAFGGSNFIDTCTMGIDQNDNIYLSAAFETSVDINPMPDQQLNVTSVDFRDNFIIKMVNANLSVPDQQLSAAFYPNPTNGVLHIDSAMSLEGRTFVVADMTGRRVMSGLLTDAYEVDLTNLNSGVYLISIGTATAKVVKQ